MHDKILSYVTGAPVSYSVYSAFSFYATRRGDELPGPWIVAALAALGHEEGTIRQTLYRMVADRELTGRSAGRVKWYRLTPFAEAEVRAGTAKILERPRAWDGRWSLVHFRFDAGERLERERVRSVLEVEGYAPLAPGLFLHPSDATDRVRNAVAALGLGDRLFVLRGRRLGGSADDAFVRAHWPIDDLATRYRRFVSDFAPLGRTLARLSDRDAFVLRFAVVLAYLEIAWGDPGLPLRLLPAPWPGTQARDLVRTMYQRLLPQALAWGDALWTSVHPRGGAPARTASRRSRARATRRRATARARRS